MHNVTVWALFLFHWVFSYSYILDLCIKWAMEQSSVDVVVEMLGYVSTRHTWLSLCTDCK